MASVDEMILANLLLARATADPNFEVLRFEGGGLRVDETRTYRQLWENGQRIASALKYAGMGKGDCFALLMQNHPEFIEAMVAASITGTVFVPIDPRIRGEKLAYMLTDSGCRGVICADYALQALAGCAHDTPGLEWIYVVGAVPEEFRIPSLSVGPLAPVLRAAVPELPVLATDPSEPMEIMYSSGTTGDPKGIVVRHVRFGTVAGHGEKVFGYGKDDRPYTGLSLTHGNAQFVTLASSLKMGLCAVFSQKFTKSRLWEITRRYGCTTFNLLGGMVAAIYSEPPRDDDHDHPVRFVISAGMPSALWEAFASRFNVRIVEFYAAIEGGMTINRGEGPIGSCGRVPPALQGRVMDSDGNECPANVSGELWFRPADGTPPVVEYFNDPEASRKKTEGGWLHSGDIARMNQDGWVFFECRKGAGIRHNGEFIAPAFVEKVIAEHPSVSDVYVYGIPSASGAPGEKDVVAAVVPREWHGFDPNDVLELCQRKLEGHCWPSFIQVVKEIPKTASEKPQERFLAQMFTDGSSQIFCATRDAVDMQGRTDDRISGVSGRVT